MTHSSAADQPGLSVGLRLELDSGACPELEFFLAKRTRESRSGGQGHCLSVNPGGVWAKNWEEPLIFKQSHLLSGAINRALLIRIGSFFLGWLGLRCLFPSFSAFEIVLILGALAVVPHNLKGARIAISIIAALALCSAIARVIHGPETLDPAVIKKPTSGLRPTYVSHHPEHFSITAPPGDPRDKNGWSTELVIPDQCHWELTPPGEVWEIDEHGKLYEDGPPSLGYQPWSFSSDVRHLWFKAKGKVPAVVKVDIIPANMVNATQEPKKQVYVSHHPEHFSITAPTGDPHDKTGWSEELVIPDHCNFHPTAQGEVWEIDEHGKLYEDGPPSLGYQPWSFSSDVRHLWFKAKGKVPVTVKVDIIPR